MSRKPVSAIAVVTAAAALLHAAAQQPNAPIRPPVIVTPHGSEAVEQRSAGTRPPAEVVASFDGLGEGFEGPQGTASLRNPSDNTLAVGPDHVVQIVNSRMAIFTKKGRRFDATHQAGGPLVPSGSSRALLRK